MAEADGVGVAVTGAYDEVGVFVGAFDALGEGKGPAVGGVGAVAVREEQPMPEIRVISSLAQPFLAHTAEMAFWMP